TDDSGLILYQRNVDYSISVIGGIVYINVIPFSPNLNNIDQSQTLLVTYRYLTDSRREENSLMQSFRFRQNFSNNTFLFYEHYRRDEDIEAFSTTALTPNEYKTDTVGAGYTYEQLLLTAEHSRTDATQTTSKSTSLRGNYNFKLNRDTSLTVHVAQAWYDFTGARSRETQLFTTGGSLVSQISDKTNLFVGVDWRDETDSDVGDTRGLRFTSELNYQFRLLTVTTGLEFYSLDR
ncbi:MAG: hypothetical protein GY869_15965, partial [Planctomycetes bacterium]|nr:hypothetical protein [Planctomycetota bacterium]